MIKSSSLARVTMNVTFSYLITAKKKSHALMMADFNINEENIIMDRIKLVDEQGKKKILKVDRVDSIRWISVELSEYSNQFRVMGQMHLTLSLDMLPEQDSDKLRITAYRFPRSIIQDKAVLVIPTTNEPAFTQVLSHSLELKAESIEAKELTRAG